KAEQQGVVGGIKKLDVAVVDRAIGVVEKACIWNIIHAKPDQGSRDLILVSQRSAEAQVIVLGYSGEIFRMHEGKLVLVSDSGECRGIPVSSCHVTDGGHLRSAHTQCPGTDPDT